MEIEKIFDASFARVLGRRVEGRAFFEAFYVHFIGASEEVAKKFRDTDMARQQAMLKKSFYHLVSFYGSSNAYYYLNGVAISHNRRHLDISPALYELWLETLVATLWDFDPQCNAEVELAWRLVMTPGIVYMKFHYDRDRPVGQGDDPPS